MDVQSFDTKKLDTYAAQAKAQWGDTPAYREFEARELSAEQQQRAGAGLMELFGNFAQCKDGAPDAPAAQAAVKTLQTYISAHFYWCTDEVLSGLGKFYGAGGEFTENIDAFAGAGTARFVERAIEAYCAARR